MMWLFYSAKIIASTLIMLAVGQVSSATTTTTCDDESGGTACFSFHSNVTNPATGNPVQTYDDAQLFCSVTESLSPGFELATIYSPDELAIAAKHMVKLNWQRALVALRRFESVWRWAFDSEPLRGQGCKKRILSDSTSQFYNLAMTIEKCTNFCAIAQKSFASITAGVLCHCSGTFMWTLPATGCNNPCPGAPEQRCGSFSTSSVLSASQAAFDNWRPGHPNSTGSCAAVNVDRRQNEWISDECGSKKPFLCQFSAFSEFLPSSGFSHRSCSDGTCLYLISDPPLTWYEADRYCLGRAGRLAAIGNQLRQQQVNAMLMDSELQVETFWIGATNLAWYYEDGSNLYNKPLFNTWLPTSDDKSYDKNEADCVELVVKSENEAGWRSRPCEFEEDFQFICSKDLIKRKFDVEIPAIDVTNPFLVPLITKPATVLAPKSSRVKTSTLLTSNFFKSTLKPSPRSARVTTESEEPPTTTTQPSVTFATPARQVGTTSKVEGSTVAWVNRVVQTRQRGCYDDTDGFPWWDILLLVMIFISLILAAVFMALYCVERRRNKTNERRSKILQATATDRNFSNSMYLTQNEGNSQIMKVGQNHELSIDRPSTSKLASRQKPPSGRSAGKTSQTLIY